MISRDRGRHCRWLALAVVALVLGSVAGVSRPAAAQSLATPAVDIARLVRDCPATPATRIPNAPPDLPAWGGGGAPLWEIGLGRLPDAELVKTVGTPIPLASLYQGPSFAGPTPWGWFMRVIWVMPPGTTTIVRVAGAERDRGEPISVNLEHPTPVTTARFDPSHPGIPLHAGAWAEFPSSVYFPATGCYVVTATWATGSWTLQIPFVSPPDAGLPAATPPLNATPAATPFDLAALLASCPYPTGVVIPGAAEYFAPWGLGGAPVWLDFWGNPPPELQNQFPGPGIPYTGPRFAATPGGWWEMRAPWVVAGGSPSPITISASRVGGGTAPLLDAGDPGGTPSSTRQLDPTHPGIPVQHGTFREWPSAIYFQTSGCYELTASWPGGSWMVRVPVVLPPDAPPGATPAATPAA